jgi:hypothetical protein
MRLGSELTLGSVSPLPLGEVGSPRQRVSAVAGDTGEGLRSIDRPYPLTPTLSPWERGRTSVDATAKQALRIKGVAF